MTNATPQLKPWLIAAWPGMGNVAIIAAGYLIQQLEMTECAELLPGGHIDVVEVSVKEGLVEKIHLPRGVFFKTADSGAARELVVFIGEAQPSTGNHAYACELLDAAARMGIERVVTFASLASGLHPSENPKVWGVATDPRTLTELRKAEVEPIADGQIAGLNGLVLGIAAGRDLAGMCLLAEIPYFAMRIPNPKAARAALSVFSVLSGIDISLGELNKQAAVIDQAIIEAMENALRQGGQSTEQPEEPGTVNETREADAIAPGEDGDEGDADKREQEITSHADQQRIAALFEDARKDPSLAIQLKNELDRLGVFKKYEGQFLDLFKRAG